MTLIRRIGQIINGIFMILFAVLMIMTGKDIYGFILVILGLSFVLSGIRYLSYYRTMARHMVGGQIIMYIGIIYLDFGIFTLTLHDSPLIYVVLYLIGVYAFTGLVDILRALEARRFSAPSWRMKFTGGVLNVTLAGLALFSGLVLHSPRYVVILYAAGLMISGFMSIVAAFRKTAIVYIQ